MCCGRQDTRTYFEGTKVTCCVVPREGGTVDSLSQKLAKGNMFTHHQKAVVVDTPDARSGSTPRVPKLYPGLTEIDNPPGPST